MNYQSLVNYLNSKEDKYSYSMIIGNIYRSNHYIKTHSNTTSNNYPYADKLIRVKNKRLINANKVILIFTKYNKLNADKFCYDSNTISIINAIMQTPRYDRLNDDQLLVDYNNQMFLNWYERSLKALV